MAVGQEHPGHVRFDGLDAHGRLRVALRLGQERNLRREVRIRGERSAPRMRAGRGVEPLDALRARRRGAARSVERRARRRRRRRTASSSAASGSCVRSWCSSTATSASEASALRRAPCLDAPRASVATSAAKETMTKGIAQLRPRSRGRDRAASASGTWRRRSRRRPRRRISPASAARADRSPASRPARRGRCRAPMRCAPARTARADACARRRCGSRTAPVSSSSACVSVVLPQPARPWVMTIAGSGRRA